MATTQTTDEILANTLASQTVRISTKAPPGYDGPEGCFLLQDDLLTGRRVFWSQSGPLRAQNKWVYQGPVEAGDNICPGCLSVCSVLVPVTMDGEERFCPSCAAQRLEWIGATEHCGG